MPLSDQQICKINTTAAEKTSAHVTSAVPVYCEISQSDLLGQLIASAKNKARARQALYPSGLVIDTPSCILTCRCVKGFSRDESGYSTFCIDLVVASGRTCSAADGYGSCFMAVHI